jgi:hypothetical protein
LAQSNQETTAMTKTQPNQITKDVLQIFKNFRAFGLKKIVQHSEDKVVFHFRHGMKKRMTMITFEMDRGKDLYIVSFGKIFKHEYKELASYADCYFDQLIEVVEYETGYITL